MKIKLNILILHSQALFSYPSGEQRVAILERQKLSQFGIRTTLVEYMSPDTILKLLNPKLDSIRNNLWSYSAYRNVNTYIDKIKPDLVHFHGIFPYLSASAIAAAHAAGVPVVQTLHNGRWLCLEGGFYRNGVYCDDCISLGRWKGVWHGCKHGILTSFLLHRANLAGLAGGRLFRWVDRFIAVSDFIRDQHVRAGFPPARIVIKNNGVDLSALQNIPRKHQRDGIVFVGRISVAKGAAVIRELAKQCRTKIHVVGDGPDLIDLKRFCADSALDHVQFWGKQPQSRCFEIMASAKCTIVPSQCGESFSLVSAESMALGTPVIATNVGGLGSLINTSGGGIVVNASDTQAFIAATQSLIDHPTKASELGFRGQRYVLGYLSIEKNIEELVEIYKTVIQERQLHAHQLQRP